MSTLADELLNDFEDSGSEGEGNHEDSFLHDTFAQPATSLTNGHQYGAISGDSTGVMVLNMDEEDEDEDEDEEMTEGGATAPDALENAADEEDAKAKVEKMQLGSVNDVRNVAGLMKTLEPVLEVGPSSSVLKFSQYEAQGLHLLWT